MMSSFPFMTVGRLTGVPYAKVLLYADALKKAGDRAGSLDDLTDDEHAILQELNFTQAGVAIVDVILQEQGRRWLVVSGDCRHD